MGQTSCRACQKPKAPSPGQLGIENEPVLVAQAEQQLTPALGALAKAILDRQQLLPAAGIGPDQDQQALPLMVKPRGEVDAVGPYVDVAAGCEATSLPARVLLLPSLSEAPDGGRRQPGCFGTEQRRQRFLELSGRDTLEVEPGQQLLDVPGPPQVGRQHRRAEADRGQAAVAAVANPRPADRECSNPGLDVPLRRVPVAHQAPTASVIGEIGVGDEERLHLGLDRLHQQAPGAVAQHRQQRIVRESSSWSRQRHNGTFLHSVSFLVT